MNPKVDFYFNKAGKWQQAIEKLRKMLLAALLTEELKWGVPCYTFENRNVVLIHTFKTYCALLFFKGALMKDDKQILIQQTSNVQAARQLRFSDVREIYDLEDVINSYLMEAIEIEKSGQQVTLKKTEEFVMPDEFKSKLAISDELNAAFYALTPGRQRAYLLHFSAPKQVKTREARIDKCIPQILAGKGLNDL